MKDPHYFQHDYNARNDEKILMARAEFNNAEAYGIFWMIIESMAETSDGFLNRQAIAPLSLSYGLAKERLEKFVAYCIEIGLFFKLGNRFSSHRMIAHKEFRLKLSKSGMIGNQSRWSHRESPPESPGDRPPNRRANPKERKEKKTKDFNKATDFPFSTTKAKTHDCDYCGLIEDDFHHVKCHYCFEFFLKDDINGDKHTCRVR